jgi:hypothetical protein
LAFQLFGILKFSLHPTQRRGRPVVQDVAEAVARAGALVSDTVLFAQVLYGDDDVTHLLKAEIGKAENTNWKWGKQKTEITEAANSKPKIANAEG